MVPKATPLFHPESHEEANWAIQVAVDTKIRFNHLNEELQEMNWQADVEKVAKAKQQREGQWLAGEQAEKDQLVVVVEKAERDQQE